MKRKTTGKTIDKTIDHAEIARARRRLAANEMLLRHYPTRSPEHARLVEKIAEQREALRPFDDEIVRRQAEFDARRCGS